MLNMDKTYSHQKAETTWYKFWEESGLFKPEINPKGKPYVIILPPPNASGKMHTGNVLMIAIEDLIIRRKRMQGYATLWVPGTDHAGTETQITFERELKKEGKSRFNFSRQELYDSIWDFVQKNKHNIENQIRKMGASVDWSRYKFTLDPDVIRTVHETFKKMTKDGLIYRGEYMVNYCPKCKTTYSDVELSHSEQKDPLYYVKYPTENQSSFIAVATVRLEPIWADTHLAVNPKDPKNKELIGQTAINPLTNEKMQIIADEFVDPDFGTGVVKLTPAVDKNDYEVAIKHNLPIIQVLDLSGKMMGIYQGLTVEEAKKKALAELESKGLIDKIDRNYKHTISQCKAGHNIEPMIMPNWFIKVDDPVISLKQPALKAVLDKKISIYPKWREITYIRWMEEMKDWAISRQNIWGIQIPVWFEIEDKSKFYVWFLDKKGDYKHNRLDHLLDEGYTLQEIRTGLQRVLASQNTKWLFEEDKDSDKEYLPETDTFDTWFSSGQWPLVTLGYPSSEDFKKFYPTQVLETGWEIIRLWVSRMIMLGIYLTQEVPFENVYLHGLVRAIDGRKMSKSLGNVINPEEYIEEFGVDALRMGLISGTANGKDFAFPRDRVISFKHLSNKIWNMARFIDLMIEQNKTEIKTAGEIKNKLQKEDKNMLKNLNILIKKVDSDLDRYRFADAGEAIYQFIWHEVADIYIENVKNRKDKEVALSNLIYVFKTSLELLHPFMPFITEELWQRLPHQGKSIMLEKWPEAKQ